MAPSATSDIIVESSNVEVAKQPDQHVRGAEDKTPLEAISHGPQVHPGMTFRLPQNQLSHWDLRNSHILLSRRTSTAHLNPHGSCLPRFFEEGLHGRNEV
jgi:hypothetical protein